jgi:hypothetical protein
VGTRTGLDDVKTKISPIPGLEPGPLGRPANRYTDCTMPTPTDANVNYNKVYLTFSMIHCINAMLGGSLVTTAWRVLRLRMEETPPSFAGQLRIY